MAQHLLFKGLGLVCVLRSKIRVSSKGSTSGGTQFGRGALYALLANPLYIGEMAHKGARYAGQHESIVDRDTWERVQQQLGGRAGPGQRTSTGISSPPLTGKIYDQAGERLTPTYAMKKRRRYSYYVSRSLVSGGVADSRQAWRVPARQLEEAIALGLAELLDDGVEIARVMDEAGLTADHLPATFDASARLRSRLISEVERGAALSALIIRVVLAREQLRMTISLAPLLGESDISLKDLTIEREVPLHIRRRGVEMKLLIGGREAHVSAPDPILLKELNRARRCFDALVSGDAKNLALLASRESVSDRYISSVLPLAFLAPEIVELIVAGRQPTGMTAHKLIRHTDLPFDWPSQKRVLGVQ
jgi:site-specific DNA recombinase